MAQNLLTCLIVNLSCLGYMSDMQMAQEFVDLSEYIFLNLPEIAK